MGTMCAMYGCPVEASAEPIDPSSRSLRVTAFQRRPVFERLRGVALFGWVEGVVSKDIALKVYTAGGNHSDEGTYTRKWEQPRLPRALPRASRDAVILISPSTYCIFIPSASGLPWSDSLVTPMMCTTF